MKTRADHLQAAKGKALQYSRKQQIVKAIASFNSDLLAHPMLREHPAIKLGPQKFLDGQFPNGKSFERFINGVS